MLILTFVTVLWAFSFSLIGVYLSADVDPYIAVFIRMLLATALLLPFLRLRNISVSYALKLASIGAVQIGVMYILLYHAFLFLSVPEVLLFTIFTPLYITLLDEALINRKSIPIQWWIAAVLSVLGAAVIRYAQPSGDFWFGFLLIQGANLTFAVGQVAYKRYAKNNPRQQIHEYALFFIGALIVSGLGSLLFADWSRIPTSWTHWAVLLWLGIGASGVGYLLWSMASKRVNIAQLATMNNLLIPAGILINVLVWGSTINWPQFICGAFIIAIAIVIASKFQRNGKQRPF